MTQIVGGNEVLHPFGPFHLVFSKHRLGGRKIEVSKSKMQIRKQIEHLKKRPALQCGDLHQKNGLYVFAIKTPGKGGPIRPFYVGKTDRQGLLDEAFKDHKETHFNDALGNCKGIPLLYFIAPEGTKKKLNKGLLRDWERILIYLAYSQNAELCNTQHVPRDIRIEGLRILSHQNGTFRRGQSKMRAAADLNKMFDL